MTRSVEIPEAAVEAAAKNYYEGLGWDWDDLGGWDEDQRREREHEESKAVILREFRAALAAALPYLAPVADGGLREALEELVDMMAERPDLGVGEHYLRELLAAHPAAPAVPQPVDREALTQALLHVWRGRIEAQVADSPEGHCAALADAVLDLLGGSETCDHSDYVTDDEAKARCGNCGKLMSAVLAGEQEQVGDPHHWSDGSEVDPAELDAQAGGERS